MPQMALGALATRASPNLGIALMATAMLIVPLVDGLAKHLSDGHSPLFIAWARYTAASAIVLPIAIAIHGPAFLPSQQLVSHGLRTVFLVVATTLYFMSIATIPLATAVSAYFVGPIIAVVLARLVLGEQLTQTKIASVALGFAGSILIAQPGPDIEPGILFAFGAGLFFALYLIATRRTSGSGDPVKTLALQCVVGTVLLTPQAVLTWGAPSWNVLLLLVGLGTFSALSHFLSITAFRFADASTLSPLVYIELFGAALVGYFLFGQAPDGVAVAGAGMILGAGLLLLRHRAK
jgi:drug/metabolite transporter (DMT)-like permease